MGRPEPCVLFAHTFVHSQLDEYVDEVVFSEPVIISACEFLEQNASSASATVTLMGATSPPSFALEAFVHCEGETRFRRLCQPFLYSHSSSNVLEVEAVVTNHLVVRGSYRSLSLVIYGNTAEDLGQFNIEVDLDTSLTNTVSATDGDLDDLPPALHPKNLNIEDSISPLKALSIKVIPSDICFQMKRFLQLTFKIMELPNLGDGINTVVKHVVSAASSYSTEQIEESRSKNSAESYITEATMNLMSIYQHDLVNSSDEFSRDSLFPECEEDMSTSKQLVEILMQFHIGSNLSFFGHPQLSKSKNMIMWLSAALLLCSSKESCFHFVNSGGMKQLGSVFSNGKKNSSAVTLILLGVIEQATRNSMGCDGFLGWWPREDENIPSGVSESYNELLKLLAQRQRHDIASLATSILHRIRFYEVSSRYECAVLSVLGGLSAGSKVTEAAFDVLTCAKVQLKKLMKLINSRGPIEDPSAVSCARRSMIFGEADELLSCKATSGFITSSKICFSNCDIDSNLLFLLKERGFLPLSAALLASPVLRSENGRAMDLFFDITSYIETIILSLLFCRSGSLFLLQDPEIATAIIHSLRGVELKNEESVPLRYASNLISKGFFCRPREVGVIVETHLRAVNAIDRLITSKLHSEEILWVLWELCCLSRSHCGRQALLSIGYFPEAVSILMASLHSVKESDQVTVTSGGASSLNLAIFHSAVEIFEVIVTDSTATSLNSWIEYAIELHRALHSSSPGSNRKDGPTRLLEWIDASVVYYRNGAIGLLRYAAVLASGGDGILTSDAMDVENVVTDAEGNVIDNLLGKPITESRFLGVTLRDSSVAQLTTAFRILAFISDNSDVVTALYDEGATMVIHAVLIDCKLMLERSSNTYDYLVDEGTEGNSTSDLLLERNREQSLVDLLVPSLLLLNNMLKRLQEANEQHRNTKLLNALMQLHREMSPKLGAYAADLSYPYPDFSIAFEAVSHILVSTMACWPIYNWTPGIFHFLFDTLNADSLLALGPKETCSLLFILNDLLPEEGACLWKNGMPVLCALRSLAVGTLLGPEKEKEINWYLHASHTEKILTQLTPHLSTLAQNILHFAISTLVVIQDMLRVFIVRLACLNPSYASLLLEPIIDWISDRLSELSSSSDEDSYKVYRLLDFLSILLDHPRAKPLLLKLGVVQIFMRVLETCIVAVNSDAKQLPESRSIFKFSRISWCTPVFKSINLICDNSNRLRYSGIHERHEVVTLTADDCSYFLSHVLTLCKLLPAGKGLVSCLSAFEALTSLAEGQSALLSICLSIESCGIEESESESIYNLGNASDWKKHPPLLYSWVTLYRSIEVEDNPPLHALQALSALCSGALNFSMDDGKSFNVEKAIAAKTLFGIPHDTSGSDDLSDGNTKFVQDLITLLDSKISDKHYLGHKISTLHPVKESAKRILVLLQNPTGLEVSLSSTDISSSMRKLANGSADRIDDQNISRLGDMYVWECPENLRQSALPAKRKISALDGSNRPRSRGENIQSENMTQSSYSRGLGPTTAPSGLTRRDTFRQRKPNSSRPPSMHVDDYIQRERNTDGTTSSNVIALPRTGSSSGRPPSIHVDEFMARRRESHIPVGMNTPDNNHNNNNNNNNVVQVETSAPESNAGKSKALKPDLDDDLQGIDIVFDGEESDTDDKLPFPQPDDNLLQPTANVVVDQNSPHSIVEETESNAIVDENSQCEPSSRMSASRPEVSLAREHSISSDRKYTDQSDDFKPLKTSAGFPSNYNKSSGPSTHLPSPGPPGYYYDHKFQPPLPPMPPPPTVLPILPQNQNQSSPFLNSMPDLQPPLPSGFPMQTDYSAPMQDSIYGRASMSSPGGSGRPPPLPPTPPPYSTAQQSKNSMYSHSISGGMMTSSYPQTLMSPMMFNRPGSMHYQGENPSQNMPIAFSQLQPLQPPQIPRPPHQPPPAHLRAEQSMGLMQNSVHGQQGMQMLQPPQASSSNNMYYQNVQTDNFQHSQPQIALQGQQGHGRPQQQSQDDASLSLQHYFSSPEAIQSLLSDRDKLCQLLEQHPKLIEMLQERL
jgi:hypothetical protein